MSAQGTQESDHPISSADVLLRRDTIERRQCAFFLSSKQQASNGRFGRGSDAQPNAASVSSSARADLELAFRISRQYVGYLPLSRICSPSQETSIGIVFQTSCAKAMSIVCRFSMVAAFHAGNASSFALIREMDVFCPTSVSSTRLRVR